MTAHPQQPRTTPPPSSAVVIASLGGIGRLRPGPGSWAAAAMLPAVLLGPEGVIALACLTTLAGWLAIRHLGRAAEEDPEWVVVDEAAGMLVALAALPPQPGWLALGATFLLFRMFDIFKPWPVCWAERRGGATGVMLDDLIAGAIAGGVVLLWDGLLPAA